VHLVVNTPTGVGARSDGYEIRRAAVAHGIPCLTTLAAGISAARAISSAHHHGGAGGFPVLCLQELHGMTRAPGGGRVMAGTSDGQRAASHDEAGVA
jgi:hypothetical protein